jgi:hypothetical protein
VKNTLKFTLPKMGAGCGGSVLRNPVGSAQATAVADALAALAERDEAFLAAELDRVAEFMTEDYLQTDTNGCVVDKKAWLTGFYEPLIADINSGKFRWHRFQRSEIKTRLMNNVVVMVGNLRMTYSRDNAARSPDGLGDDADVIQFTHVWAMRDATWKLAVVHNSKLMVEDL